MNDAQKWTGSHNSVAISSPHPLTTIIIVCNIVIGKEPNHSEYYCCTVVTAVCTRETQMQYNSSHFLIQYSYNTGRFEVSIAHARRVVMDTRPKIHPDHWE